MFYYARACTFVYLFVCMYVCVMLLSIVYFKTHWSCVQKRDIFLLHKKLPKYREGLGHLYYYYYYNALRWFQKDFFFLRVFFLRCVYYLCTHVPTITITRRAWGGQTGRTYTGISIYIYIIYIAPSLHRLTPVFIPAILTGFIRIIFFPPFLRFLYCNNFT